MLTAVTDILQISKVVNAILIGLYSILYICVLVCIDTYTQSLDRDTHWSAAVVSMVTAWSTSQSTDWKRGAPPESSPN